jgi:DNA (cytosine-5)-methyltransferase 1
MKNIGLIKLLYIDLFCGAGGTSTGVESARLGGEKCAQVIACVNHDANAIASHAANHPDAIHFTEDIRTLELSPLVAHVEKMKAACPEALVVLWASLECTNFSNAKGGKARDADSRTLADHLFRYIEAIRPNYIQIENVEEFMCWGDLDENGKPVSREKGAKYLRWVERVKEYGYHYEYRILNAADYGAYTSRKRYFSTFAKQGLPIVFPAPTHEKNPATAFHFVATKKWKPVKDVLDFSDEGESLFTRKKPLSDKTLERIYVGLIKFVAGGKDNFLSAYYGSGENFEDRINRTAKSTDEPCGVVTTENRFAKVQAKFLTKYYGNPPNQEANAVSVESPAPTLTTKDRLSIVSSNFIMSNYSRGHNCVPIDGPCTTIVNNPTQTIVSCFLLNPQYYSKGGSAVEWIIERFRKEIAQ